MYKAKGNFYEIEDATMLRENHLQITCEDLDSRRNEIFTSVGADFL